MISGMPNHVAKLLLLLGLPVAASAQDGNAEREAWLAALDANSPAALEQYLADYPAGAYAPLAFRCLIENQLLSDYRPCSANNSIGPPAEARATSGNIPIQLN